MGYCGLVGKQISAKKLPHIPGSKSPIERQCIENHEGQIAEGRSNLNTCRDRARDIKGRNCEDAECG